MPCLKFLAPILLLITITLTQASESDDSGVATGGPQSPSPEVVKAWRAAGGYVENFEITPLQTIFTQHQFLMNRESIAGFMFYKVKKGFSLTDSPDPRVPFGVNFYTVKDEYLEQLKSHKNLKGLSFYTNELSIDGYKSLGELENLESLRFEGNLDVDAAKEIAKLKNLKHLWMLSCSVTPEILEELQKLPKLEAINLAFSPNLNGKGFEVLCKMKTLKMLDVYNADITDKDLADLPKLKNLEHLSLGQTKITHKGLEHILSLKTLKTLDVMCIPIGDAGLHAIIEKFSDLESLAFSDLKLTNQGVKELRKLKKLRHLEMRNLGIDDEGFKLICELKWVESMNLMAFWLQKGFSQHLPNLTNLKKLRLDGDRIIDADLVPIGKLDNLEWLDLSQNEISDTGLESLHRLKKLRYLNVAGTKVTSKGIAALREVNPKCEVNALR